MSKRVRIAGVVLAAGQSRRMGRPKALLPCGPGGEPFAVRLVRTLREGGLDEVLVVGRPGDAALRRLMDGLRPSAKFIENTDPDRGQLSSLVAAIDQAERDGAEAVMVMPVDIPTVRPATIAAAVRAFADGGFRIVRVTHDGRHGHPVIFSAALFDDLRRADPAAGAKAVLRDRPDDILNLEVEDPGVLRDVDVVSDYRAIFGTDPD